MRLLATDLNRMVGGRSWRYLTLWQSPSMWTNVSYRVDRAGFLLFGRGWAVARPACFPLFLGFRLMGGRGDIHYRAEIGGGFVVLHPELGVVVSARAVIGDNLILTGGNCVGWKEGAPDQPFILGDRLNLGANAVVLGPIEVGNNVTVGAGAVVVADAEDNSVLVGVPARSVLKK